MGWLVLAWRDACSTRRSSLRSKVSNWPRSWSATPSKAAERYPGITTYRSVEELLADSSIKLVVVATPNSTHFRIASQALEAAKSVVVDKPVALSSGEIAQLSELAGGIGLQSISVS